MTIANSAEVERLVGKKYLGTGIGAVEASLWQITREGLHQVLHQAVGTMWHEYRQFVACAGGAA